MAAKGAWTRRDPPAGYESLGAQVHRSPITFLDDGGSCENARYHFPSNILHGVIGMEPHGTGRHPSRTMLCLALAMLAIVALPTAAADSAATDAEPAVDVTAVGPPDERPPPGHDRCRPMCVNV